VLARHPLSQPRPVPGHNPETEAGQNKEQRTMGTRAARAYSLRLKINAILELSTQTNVSCKMTKMSFVFYEKDLAIVLSFM
jgi:hypothetical protein